MWTRAELKERGKAAFKRNYWICVLVALIFGALMAGGAATGSGELQRGTAGFSATAEEPAKLAMVIGMLLLGIGGTLPTLISLFIRNPLTVGASRFFLVNAKAPAGFSELLYSFNGRRYLTTVGAMLLVKVLCALWGILLVIPGIIASYRYSMVPYILADDPDISITDALRRSHEMMQGQKWDAFVLDLSFIGWYLLSACTCGLLNLFYVNPYKYATGAELYLALKK